MNRAVTSQLFTNLTGPDSVRNAFYLFSAQPCDVMLACPFFSNDTLVGELLDRKCNVRLIVRLGSTTDSGALSRVVRRTGVQLRYFTSSLFHAKLYIFGQVAALIGSPNLTETGVLSNREIAIAIGPEDDRFDRLLSLYDDYWQKAEVLTPARCEEYAELQKRWGAVTGDSLDTEVRRRFGDTAPTGIQVGRPVPTKEKTYLESYRRTYQEFLDAFGTVEQRYKKDGRRQQPEAIVPLRFEIDQFLSYVVEEFVTGESYDAEPVRHGVELEGFIDDLLEQWFGQRSEYLDTDLASHYRKLNSALGSPDKIRQASAEQLFDALDVCHSIHGRLRFFPGGHPKMRETFLHENTLPQLQKVLVYLLHGKGDYVERMANCIFGEEYKLQQFGRAAVQELYGWINADNIPICNGRTVKALRYLGFKVIVFN